MRKLASLQTVKHVRPIAGADAIETIGVLGWECVAKKGEFRAGDACVYFEIDSLLPEEPRFEFLRKSSFKADLGKFRLRTVRLRKQLSQGLALPLELFPGAKEAQEREGIVVRSICGSISFKAINNDFLLKDE